MPKFETENNFFCQSFSELSECAQLWFQNCLKLSQERTRACECDRLIVQQFNRVITSQVWDGMWWRMCLLKSKFHSCVKAIFCCLPSETDTYSINYCCLDVQSVFPSNCSWRSAWNTPTWLWMINILMKSTAEYVAWRQRWFDWRCLLKQRLVENEPWNSFLYWVFSVTRCSRSDVRESVSQSVSQR